MKKLSFFLFAWSICFTANAQKKNAYLYLELNKNLPVDVRINNRLLENEEKGYIIIPGQDLQSGPNTLAFEFKNPEFTRHTFSIINNGQSMGLKLSRIAKNRFALQDVLTDTIINAQPVEQEKTTPIKPSPVQKSTTKVALNKEDKAEKTSTLTQEVNEEVNKEIVTIEVVSFQAEQKKDSLTNDTEELPYAMYRNRSSYNQRTEPSRYKDYAKERRLAKRRARLNKKTQKAKASQPAKAVLETKINDTKTNKVNGNKSLSGEKQNVIQKTTNNSQIKEKEISRVRANNQNQENSKAAELEEITNSNSKTSDKPLLHKKCSQSVSANKISVWTNRLSKKFDDEARENFLKRKIGTSCINSTKVGLLLGYFDTQIGRYLFIKEISENIEDPQNLNRLHKYFSSTSYINKLKELEKNIN